jgi:hypothetical protein
MPDPSQALRQVITRLLTEEAAQSRDQEDPTAPVVRVYEQFAYRLAPLIGEVGVEAILNRSGKLTQADFPFFTASAVVSRGDSVPLQLWKALKEQEAATVGKASEALLTAFAALVIKLIGERLAWRLLFDLSPEIFPDSPQQRRTG